MDVSGKIFHQANLSHIQEGVQYCSDEIIICDGIGSRFSCIGRGFADDLPHPEPSTRKHQRSESPPVIPAPIFLKLRCSTHFPTAHEKNLITQSAVLKVIQKGRHSMLECNATIIHNLRGAGIIFI